MRQLGCALAALAIAASAPALATDSGDGRALYDARCGGCHNQSVHSDTSRKARNFEAMRARVAEFAARVEADWTGDQIDRVAVYLNERYYAFPCPAALCPAPARR